MKKEVTFFKQDGKWYADVPNHTLEENEMVMGADIALELLSADYNAITLHLTDEEPNDYQLAFKMTEHDEYGAYYAVSGPLYNLYLNLFGDSQPELLANTIWICNVTHDVFGEHPNTIYVTNINQFNRMTEEEIEAEIHKEYNRKQCVYGENSTMPCMICSATCRERYEDFTKKGVKIVTIPIDNKDNGDS